VPERSNFGSIAYLEDYFNLNEAPADFSLEEMAQAREIMEELQ
jgi:hypothetical protein